MPSAVNMSSWGPAITRTLVISGSSGETSLRGGTQRQDRSFLPFSGLRSAITSPAMRALPLNPPIPHRRFVLRLPMTIGMSRPPPTASEP